jgi:hypothetical protein
VPPAKTSLTRATPKVASKSGFRRQHFKIDRVGHCLISIILRMEMIAGIECCEDVRRTVRIPCHCVASKSPKSIEKRPFEANASGDCWRFS